LRRRMDAVLDARPVMAERGARHIAGGKLYLPALAARSGCCAYRSVWWAVGRSPRAARSRAVA
jgi:hypothetical protein